jgi:hypothetical protein
MKASKRVRLFLRTHLPGPYESIRDALPSTRRLRKSLAAKSTQDRFVEIYRGNNWGHTETRSGAGSTLGCTGPMRHALPSLLRQLGIRTLLDAPCGDFNWMQHVELDVDRYIGADIVPELIDLLNEHHGNDRRSFMVLDLTRDPLPRADALFCRDCHIHLSFTDVHATLETFRRSECAYLIASTYPSLCRNVDIVTGESRALNLQRAPFELPEPIAWLPDATEGNAIERRMGVWRGEQIRRSVPA